MTAELIAELRRAADKKRDDLALQSASLFTRAADALEAATPRVVSTVAELDSLPGNSVLYSETCWAVLRKQSHLGNDWVTDHASHNRHAISATETLAWAQDWELGGTE